MYEINQQQKKREASQAKEKKMRVAILLAIMLTLFVSALVIGRQSTSSDALQESKKNDVQSPNQAQESKETGIKLKKRDIRLTITPLRYSETAFDNVPTDRYKVGEMVKIKTEMTNLTADEVEVVMGDHHFQNRFRLLKDGKPVLYRRDVQKRLKKLDEAIVPYIGSRFPFLLKSNQPVMVGIIPLSIWYDSLEPGHYELTVQHRFWGKEQPIESNTVTFEIVP